MTILELYNRLEAKLPPVFSEEIDADGAQCVPQPGREVKRVLVSLDPYGAAVDEAIKNGYDLLLTHHPLIYGERVPGTPPDRWFNQLYSHGVAQISFHMRLDNAPGGVNDVLAELVGLRNVTSFGILEAPELGRIGELASPLSPGELADRVKNVLNAEKVIYTDLPDDASIHRVAVVGGAASDFLEAAKSAGADAIVGGEFKHHTYGYAAEMGISIIEAGHFHTEDPVCQVLAEFVRKILPDAEVRVFSQIPTKVI